MIALTKGSWTIEQVGHVGSLHDLGDGKASLLLHGWTFSASPRRNGEHRRVLLMSDHGGAVGRASDIASIRVAVEEDGSGGWTVDELRTIAKECKA